MTKTMRELRKLMPVIDVVVELLDARIPAASKNPDIDVLARGKRRLIVLNKADAADPAETSRWKARYEKLGFAAMPLNSLGGGAGAVIAKARELCADRDARLAGRGRVGASTRVLVAGVPNVGKSTFINRLAGRNAARTADTPGVTRGRQWITLAGGVELLDTPGVLWPRMNDSDASLMLALVGSVKAQITDGESLAAELIGVLAEAAPPALSGRYGEGAETLEGIARSRGFLRRGGVPDTERAAITLLDEFRAGKLGRITLEKCRV
jgi:ribosome biogenesis GTPase A